MKALIPLLLFYFFPLLAQNGLKDAYEGKFRIGAALNRRIVSGSDPEGAALAAAQFNTITPENDMKWEMIHPQPGVYNFGPADKFVEFGEKHEMLMFGHTLIWHSQTPKWVFQDEDGKPVTRDLLLARMKDHIHTVVVRYKGRIAGWDVVNEALDEDGTMRKSPWYNIIGEDFVARAFQFAQEADPNAKLIYNDYSLANDAKRAGAIRLVKRLKDAGVRIDIVGMQGHLKLDWPSPEKEDQSIREIAAAGVKVAITELDIDVLPQKSDSTSADVGRRESASAGLDPYTAGLPKEVENTLAKRYAELFTVFLKNRDVIERVTFWGLSNRDSWLNGWPIRGRTNHPLLFDRQRQPTAAFAPVLDLGKNAR
jgi:endo-1,4-beta-xylanase